jgi:hypothetical protein
MSYPPGPPDPAEPRDPWATPTGGAPGTPEQPATGQQGQEQDPYGQQYGQGDGQQYGQGYGQQYGPGYGQPGYGQPAPGQPPYGAPQPTNGKAQGALWSGIGLLVTSCCGLGLLGVIPVVLGVKARREIRESQGRQAGDGLALAGIVTGAIAVVLSLIAIVFWVVVLANFSTTSTDYSTF